MTTTETKRDKLARCIQLHGRQLLAIFPEAAEKDPDRLCRKLRKLESEAHQLAENACNGVGSDHEAETERVVCAVQRLLRDDAGRVWINGDPRGYALKINLRPGEQLYQDFGGYGIIAPDLREA